MRGVLQRVSSASVTISGRVSGKIERGYLLLAGWTAQVAGVRRFAEADDNMNLALAGVGGAVLVVSQFTLYGNAEKGRRPSFIDAARPEEAIPLYEDFVSQL